MNRNKIVKSLFIFLLLIAACASCEKSSTTTEVKSGENVTLNGVCRKNTKSIHDNCTFVIKESETFYVEYCQSVPGDFEVGLIGEDGDEVEADSYLCNEGDIAQIKVSENGNYSFYLKGTNLNEDLLNIDYNFKCSIK